MIAMGMGNDGALNGAPGVDVKIPGWAVETFRSGDDKIHCVVGIALDGLI
jgi:hypothetical protein